VRDASHEVGEGGQVLRGVGFEMIQRLECVAERAGLLDIGGAEAEPGTKGVEWHVHKATALRHHSAVSRPERSPILTAEWRHVAMFNYVVDPAVLEPHVPAGTHLDLWEGRAVVSVVALRFLRMRVLWLPVPFHRDYPQVNLRFYVARDQPGGAIRRGVVFLRELVPRRLLATAARWGNNEPYAAAPIYSAVAPGDGRPVVRYSWHLGGQRHGLEAEAVDDAATAPGGSEAEFITCRHWGYTRQRDGSTSELEVRHPSWTVWPARGTLAPDPDARRLVPGLEGHADSVLIADGSPVTVFRPRTL
jgi:uncharacterized protein YqjF (DUF2071 family)